VSTTLLSVTIIELVIAVVSIGCLAWSAWIDPGLRWRDPQPWALLGMVLCDVVWLLRLTLDTATPGEGPWG
jgi:hypothetical protein